MEASRDTDDDTLSDADILKRRREALRAFVDDIASHIQTLDLPETYLEAERAARAITVHDRAIQILPLAIGDAASDHPEAALKPIRRLLRRYADRVMEAVTFITKPDSFLEGERAGRYALAADRMLSQLYEAPKPAKAARFADDDMDEAEEPETSGEQPNWRIEYIAKTDRRMARFAKDCGIWPDGTPFDTEAPAPKDPWIRADSLTMAQCKYPESGWHLDHFPALLVVNRVNAVTRALARKDGRWPDYSAFHEDDPDYYDVSSYFDERVLDRPPPDPPPQHKEIANRIGFPWWLVRKVPP